MSTQCRKIMSLQLLERQGPPFDDEHARLISEHLAECGPCRVESTLLATLGEDEIQDHLPPLNELQRRRDQDAVLRLLEEKRRNRIGTPSWHRGVLWAGGTLAAAACACLFLMATRGGPAPSSPQHPDAADQALLPDPPSAPEGVAGPSESAPPSSAEDVIETGADSTVMTLAEGARVELDPHTRILLKREADGIAVDLRRGTLLADITPGSPRPRFRVSTPLGQVVVKGTIFSVQVSGDAVRVSVLRGQVAVSRQGRDPVFVSAGETLRMDTGPERPMTPKETRDMARRVRLLSEDVVSPAPASPEGTARGQSNPSPDDTATDSSAPTPGSLLARAARLRREARWSKAATAYRRLIETYAHRSESQVAMVALGEIFLERMNDPASAARWYARYQKESPNGPLVQEAMFGEIQSLQKIGERVREQRLLKTFLGRFPNAVQAKAAKRRMETLLQAHPEDPSP